MSTLRQMILAELEDPTAIYTHLEPDLIQAGYQRLLDGPLSSIVTAFAQRLAALQTQDPHG